MMKVIGVSQDLVEILSGNEMIFMSIDSFRKMYGEPHHGMIL